MKKEYTQVGARIRANEKLRSYDSLCHLIGKTATIIDMCGYDALCPRIKWDDPMINDMGYDYWSSSLHLYFDLTDEQTNERFLDQQRRKEFAARYL